MKRFLTRFLSTVSTVAIVLCSGITTSAQAQTAAIKLADKTSIAGKLATVDLSVNSNNLCAGYNVDIEFDDALEVVEVDGTMATCQIGNVVSIVNFTGSYFKDDEAVSSITFKIPNDAKEGTQYDVKIKNIADFTTDSSSIEDITVENATIEVIEAEKPLTNYLIYNEGTSSAEVGLRGDCSGDGAINLQDAIFLAKYLLNKKADNKQLFFGDVNQDSKVNLTDVVGVCKYIMSSNKETAWETILAK